MLWSVSFSWIVLVTLLTGCTSQTDLAVRCETCRKLVKNFKAGLVKTAKSNFGGGNTHWEEKKLGSYTFSETRFLEIMENVCSDDSKKECHHMLEANENIVENWWFKQYAKGEDTELNDYLCVSRLRVCCPNGTFGMECKECAGGRARPCKGNGRCLGEGTRTGTGECTCDAGYRGNLCDECTDGYYEEMKNDTHTSCKSCHVSCKQTCSEAGPTGCDECGEGWQLTDDAGCIDENECEDEMICKDDEYCINNEGSYKCLVCNEACNGCTTAGNDHCIECKSGYHLNEQQQCVACDAACNGCTAAGNDHCIDCKTGYLLNEQRRCVDIDECIKRDVCNRPLEKCINIPGSFRCSCEEGFVASDSGCQKKEKPKPTNGKLTDNSKKSSSSTNSKKGSAKQSGMSPSGKKTKGSGKMKEKRKILRDSGWKYFGTLIGLIIAGNVLKSYVKLQSMISLAVWTYLYMLSPVIDKAITRSSR